MRIESHLAWVVNRRVVFVHRPMFAGGVSTMSEVGYTVTFCETFRLTVALAVPWVHMVSWYSRPPLTLVGSQIADVAHVSVSVPMRSMTFPSQGAMSPSFFTSASRNAVDGESSHPAP